MIIGKAVNYECLHATSLSFPLVSEQKVTINNDVMKHLVSSLR